jgi:hypothetical protein
MGILVVVIAVLVSAACATEAPETGGPGTTAQAEVGVDFRVSRSAITSGMEPSEVAWVVIKPMWNGLKTPYEPDPRLGEATPGQRAVYALTWLESEVSNGGFEQYFWNSTGFLWPEAIEGARLLGASEYEAILRAAGSVFPGGRPSRNRAERQEVVDHLSAADSDRLSDLDNRFFALLDDRERTLSLYFKRYIDRHPDEFFRP